MTAPNAPRQDRAARDDEFHDLRRPVYLLAPEARARSRAAVAWRPLGYLTLTIVWAVLALISVAVAVLVLPWRLTAGDAGPLGEAPGFHGNVFIGAVIVLLLGPVIGSISGVFLCVSVGSALGSATYFCRSLLPGYRSERLSFTSFSQGAEASGPASLFGLSTAYSLIPVRLTRWTKIVTLISAQGQVVNVTLWVLGFWWGIFYVFTVGWMLWPAQGAASVVCTVISVLLFAVFALRVAQPPSLSRHDACRLPRHPLRALVAEPSAREACPHARPQGNRALTAAARSTAAANSLTGAGVLSRL